MRHGAQRRSPPTRTGSHLVHCAQRRGRRGPALRSASAFGLITFVGRVSELGGTTALLLLAVFTVVNISSLVFRKDVKEHKHFVAPTALPVLDAFFCAYLVGPGPVATLPSTGSPAFPGYRGSPVGSHLVHQPGDLLPEDLRDAAALDGDEAD